ncbi:MAG: hypothetical protein VXZ96_15430 [Myxococcota bacterium]|nr:hypothetical protein [Myxococcota bacterium]
MPSYQFKSTNKTPEEEKSSHQTSGDLSNQSQVDLFNERKGPNVTAGLESQQLSLFGDAEGKALSTWLNTPGESARSTTPIRENVGSTYQSTRTSQPEPNIRNTFTYKSGSSVEFAPNRAEGQLELNFNQSNLDTGINRSASAGSKLTVGGNPFQSPRDLSVNGTVNLNGNQTQTRFNEDGSTTMNQMGANLSGNANNQGIQSGTLTINGSRNHNSTETGPDGIRTQNSNLNASGALNASRNGFTPSVSAGYNKTESNINANKTTSQSYGINGNATRGSATLNLSRQQNTGTQLGNGVIHNQSDSQSINLGTRGVNASFGSESHKRETAVNLENGGSENRQIGNTKSNVRLGVGASGLEGKFTGSSSLWNRDRRIGTSQSTLSLLETKASTALRRRAGLVSGEASADLNLVNAKTKRDFNSPRTNVIGEQFGADSTLSASGMLGAHAEGKGEFNRGLSGGVEAFAGAKAGAKAEGALVWERKNDYSDVLRDHFSNFPGTWDDNLVDKIPEPWLNKGSRLLFGSGRTRLATGSVGADARVGIGGELSGHAGMAEDGLIEFGGSAGGAFGLGGGVSTSGGVNPVAIGRLGMLKGMEGVNTGYDRASELSEQARERASDDAMLVGAALENQRQEGGLLGKLAGSLIHLDRWFRGIK